MSGPVTTNGDEKAPPEPVRQCEAHEPPLNQPEALTWWKNHGLANGWYPGMQNGAVLTLPAIEEQATAAVCAILNMHNLNVPNGDAAGMVANIIRHLGHRLAGQQPPQWTHRSNPEGDIPAGTWWASDGNVVWMIHSTGVPGSNTAASKVRFLTPCIMPEPPEALKDR